MVAVRKVRLGLVVMGVPSSSSRVGGWVMGWEAETEVALAWTDDCVVRATLVLELEERAWKKGGGAVTLGGWGCRGPVLCFLGAGVGVATSLAALRLATEGFPSDMSSV